MAMLHLFLYLLLKVSPCLWVSFQLCLKPTWVILLKVYFLIDRPTGLLGHDIHQETLMSPCLLWSIIISVSYVVWFLEECVKPPDRQDTMMSFHTTGSSKEVMGSTSTLQVVPSIKKSLTHIQVLSIISCDGFVPENVSSLFLAEFQ